VLVLNNWVASRGYLVFKKHSPIRSTISGVVSLLKGKKPFVRREIDWERTRAFFSGTVGNIFINLKGREPAGIVEPSDYETLCGVLAEELASCTDPQTGALVVERVVRNNETAADQERAAPDLVVTFRKGYGVVGDEIALHDIADTGEIMADAKNWSGNHEKEGIFIAWGGQFRKSLALREAEIIDAAPTILFGLDVPVPRTMDGKVLTEIFTEGFRKRHPVRYSDALGSSGPGPAELDDVEKDAIQEQLRNLGYIE
jgi:predicted AlkP superfamily phosphohydrolase/phosphomutase